MSPLRGSSLQYPEVFTAIGRFVAKQGLTNVCVLEFENGIIVTGSVLYEAGESYQRRTETHVLSAEDLGKLLKGATK